MTAPISFHDGAVVLHPGDCRDAIRAMPDASVDAVVTDPPYALDSIRKRFGVDKARPVKPGKTGVYARSSGGFMGRKWDTGDVAFDPAFWREIARVLKPGGHVAAFSHSTTWDLLLGAIRAAGFEVRDTIFELADPDAATVAFLDSLTEPQVAALAACLDTADFNPLAAWVYGSGFPKSHNVASAIDKALGAKGAVVPAGDPVKRMIPGAEQHRSGGEKTDGRTYQPGDYIAATAAAARWRGFGTALKPAIEPIVLARKPLVGSVAANVLAHGTGALNIDACRVPYAGPDDLNEANRTARLFSKAKAEGRVIRRLDFGLDIRVEANNPPSVRGRWPANVVLDGSDAAAAAFPETEAGRQRTVNRGPGGIATEGHRGQSGVVAGHADAGGSAARFFYSAKADADDRAGSAHPTVKPVDLKLYLARLITPPGGLILDPFAGSGTTGAAALRGGFRAVLCEREAEHVADIARRMELESAGPATRKAAIGKARADRFPPSGPPDLFGGGADLPALTAPSTAPSPTKTAGGG